MSSSLIRLLERALVNPEVLLVVILWSIGAIAGTLAYVRGGTAWLGWLQRKNGWPDDKDFLTSGAPLEIAVLTFAGVLLVVVNSTTTDASILAFLKQQWAWAIALTAFTTSWCVYHCITESRRDPRLANGYWWYAIYNTVLFTFYVLAGALVVWQLSFDYTAFIDSRDALNARLAYLNAVAPPSADVRLAEIEHVNNLNWAVVSGITEQINTLFLIFFFMLAMATLTQFTPVRAAYTEAGLRYTSLFLALILVIVLGASWFAFNALYLDVLAATSRVVENQQDLLLSASLHSGTGGGATVMRRYYEIVGTLRDRRGITGFALMLANDRGGVLLALWLMQILLGPRLRALVGSKVDGVYAVRH